MKYVVMYSGGIASYMAVRRMLFDLGIDKGIITLLFTDTKIEDPDLYRFLDDTSEFLGIPVTKIADGRTPWEVFRDERFLGNSRIDPCSKILKRQLSSRWLKENCDSKEATVVLGMDWEEQHRFKSAQARYESLGYKCISPLCDDPYITRWEMFELLKKDGIKPPRLYELGFSHNNCGGGCVKAGQGHFSKLLKTLPNVYKTWEDEEQKLRDMLGDVSILKITTGKASRQFTLKEIRERIESGGQVDMFDLGGCGCFVDMEEE